MSGKSYGMTYSLLPPILIQC